MKTNKTTNTGSRFFATSAIISGLVVALSILFFTLMFWTKPDKISASSSIAYDVQDYESIDPVVPSDTPHYIFESLTQNQKALRRLKNGDFMAPGSYFSMLNVVAVYRAYYCDTCIRLTKDIPGERKNYLELPGWQLKTTDRLFMETDVAHYVKQGQPYLRKLTALEGDSGSNRSNFRRLKVVDLPVKFWHTQDRKSILIPISETQSNILNVAIGAFLIAVIWGFCYIVVLFVRFLIALSKGYAFTSNNLRTLKIIGWSAISFPIGLVILNLLLRLLFNSYFTKDVSMNPDVAGHWVTYLIVGTAFLLLQRAFKAGKTLQDEAELTV